MRSTSCLACCSWQISRCTAAGLPGGVVPIVLLSSAGKKSWRGARDSSRDTPFLSRGCPAWAGRDFERSSAIKAAAGNGRSDRRRGRRSRRRTIDCREKLGYYGILVSCVGRWVRMHEVRPVQVGDDDRGQELAELFAVGKLDRCFIVELG